MSDGEAGGVATKRALPSDEAAGGRLKRIKSEAGDQAANKLDQLSVNNEHPPRPPSRQRGGNATKARAAAKTTGRVLDTWTYTPGDLLPELPEHIGNQLKVYVPARFLTIHNDRVTERQVWGTDIYTDDSDMVAVLVHADKITLSDTPPAHDLLVTLRILEGTDRYPGTIRKNLRSRMWMEPHEGCSVKVEKVEKVKAKKPEDLRDKEKAREKLLKQRLKQKSVNAEKGRAKRDKTSISEQLLGTSVVFSLANDPCIKYTQNVVADRGTQPQAYTAYRFHTGVLYLETDQERYELSLQRSDSSGDVYQWARVHEPHLMPVKVLSTLGVPLPADKVAVLEQDLKWTELTWNWDAVRVRGTRYQLARAFWRPISAAQTTSADTEPILAPTVSITA